MTAFRLELRRSRSLVVWLAVSLAAYGGIMGVMYPFLKSNDALMQQYLNTFPKEFLAAFGMTGVLSDPGVFYTTYIASWLWPIIATAAALLLGTRAVAADLDRGFLDLPLATRLSRVRYLATNVGAQVLAMAVLAAAAVASVWLAAAATGNVFDPGGYALAGVLSFVFGCAIAGPTTLLSVTTLSRGRASGIVGGVVFAMYAVFVVAQVSSDWAWIAPISAWDHFRTTELIDRGVIPTGDLVLFAVIALVSWLAALWAFRQRDLAA
jgi:ABC-type transport system involved in multi-copper enzyme maturation permease subunit